MNREALTRLPFSPTVIADVVNAYDINEVTLLVALETIDAYLSNQITFADEPTADRSFPVKKICGQSSTRLAVTLDAVVWKPIFEDLLRIHSSLETAIRAVHQNQADQLSGDHATRPHETVVVIWTPESSFR